MRNKDFKTFVEDLKKVEILDQYGPELALIKPGNWEYFIAWAKSIGYNFDFNEIKSYFENHKEVLEKIAQHPVMGTWSTMLYVQ